MKKILVLLILIVTIYSCGNNPQNTSVSGHSVALMKSSGPHDISIEDALTLISNFINQYESISKNVAIGGAFDKGVLHSAGVQSTSADSNRLNGTIFLECYNHSSVPNWLRLYARQVSNYDSSSAATYTPANSDYYFKADSMFVYTSRNKDTATVRSFLKNQQFTVTGRYDSSRYDAIKQYCDSFLTKFTVNSNSYGFFNLTTVNDLLNQQDSLGNNVCVGMNYYFGYDETATGNKIRIILIGVDSVGKNILTIDGQPAKILDHNWPPKLF